MTTEITEHDRDLFIQNGWLVLRQQFSVGEISALQRECDRLWNQTALFEIGSGSNSRKNYLSGDLIQDRLDPVICHSKLIAELVYHERIVQILTLILGDRPILFKDKLIVKPPMVTGYGAHQDLCYFDFFGIPTDGLITALVAVDSFLPESGALELFSGLHHNRLPSPPHESRDVDEAFLASFPGTTPELEPGDLVVFHCLTPHRSQPNRSDQSRPSVYFTYNAARYGDFYDRYLRHRLQHTPANDAECQS